MSILNNNKHKIFVEQDKDYMYCGSFKNNNKYYINVKHKYCKKITSMRLDT